MASSNGGAICIESASVMMSNSTLRGNQARFGGALSVENGHLTVTNCSVESNTASENGGAVRADQSKVLLLGSHFRNNRVSEGGTGGSQSLHRDLGVLWGCMEEYVEKQRMLS